jgi:hypothetical protein
MGAIVSALLILTWLIAIGLIVGFIGSISPRGRTNYRGTGIVVVAAIFVLGVGVVGIVENYGWMPLLAPALVVLLVFAFRNGREPDQ